MSAPLCRAHIGRMLNLCGTYVRLVLGVYMSGVCRAHVRLMLGVCRAYAGRMSGLCGAYVDLMSGLCWANVGRTLVVC